MPPEAERHGGGVRCFVAVDLAPDVLAAIGGVIEAMRTVGGDVRWVAPGNLHVTLKFIGNVPEERVDTVRAALEPVAATTAPFAVVAAGLGVFPNPRRARVVWVGVQSSQLGAVALGVDDALGARGFSRESRAFSPHVTIGRVRTPRGWDRVLAALQPYWEQSFGTSQVDQIVTYRSELRREGARYTALHQLPLRQDAAGTGP
jgi:2'-5' RNA ligase